MITQIRGILRAVAEEELTLAVDPMELEVLIPDHTRRALQARVGELEINGCDFLHTGTDGLIDEFTVMLRPLKAVNAFAEKMGVEFARAMQEAGR